MQRTISKRERRVPLPRSSDKLPKRQKRWKKGGVYRSTTGGYDAGKKIKGKKRHILVDTLGLLLSATVHSADIQDRHGAALVLDARTRALFPFIERIFADGGYQGPRVRAAAARTGTWKVEIIKRSDIAKGFIVLPKRWIVERTIAWLNRCRRLAKDWECLNRKALAFLRLASIRLMLRSNFAVIPYRCFRTDTNTTVAFFLNF